MRWMMLLMATGLAIAGAAQAKSPPTQEDLQLAAAESLITAFYSFDLIAALGTGYVVNAGACKQMFAGGPTPQACVHSVVQGFKEYTARPRG